ncbi:MAG: hypothetical protein KJ069_15630 [Anaerolineae bacterium]|nr:hypothetical protein [Anaerolineae bacterium]
MNKVTSLLMLVVLTAVSCQQPAATPTSTGEPTATPLPPTPTPPPLGAGMRYSRYGPWYDPGPAYWAGVAQQMAGYFPGAVSQAVWIVGTAGGQGTALNFPGQTDKPYIYFTSPDKNEEVLTLFDEMGGRCGCK